MDKLLFRLLMAALPLFTAQFLRAQGCSDAGFCTLNSFKPAPAEAAATARNQVKLGASYGAADYDIGVAGAYLEYGRTFNDRWGVDVKVTALAQNGPDLSVFGLSDLYANVSYGLGGNTRLTLGAKIPFSDGNREEDGLPLPMDYQASLGTVDLLAGIGTAWGRLQLVAALQQPLTRNSNAFLAENYPAGSEIGKIQSTNAFDRAGDVLLRVSYPIGLGEKLAVTPSLLPIYHLANDKFTDGAGTVREIDGSQGLTLNGNVYLDYTLNEKNALQLNLGVPFVVRDARPDGLTRSFVATLEYRIGF